MTDLAAIVTALTAARMVSHPGTTLNVIELEVAEMMPLARRILALCGEDRKPLTERSKLGDLSLSKRARSTLGRLLVGHFDDTSMKAVSEITIEQAAAVIDLGDLVGMKNTGAITINEIQHAFRQCGKELRWTTLPATTPAISAGPPILPVDDLRKASFRDEAGNNG